MKQILLALIICCGCSQTRSLDKKNNTKEKIYSQLRLVLPELKIIDKELHEAVDIIKQKSKIHSKDHEAINIFIAESLQSPKKEYDPLEVEENKTSKNDKKFLIHLEAKQISVAEAIKLICDQLGLMYKVTSKEVIIDLQKSISQFETRFYPVPKKLITEIQKSKKTLKNYFSEKGVNFPHGSNLKFSDTKKELIFTNVETNHLEFKKLLTEE